jgi:hypothetical protein
MLPASENAARTAYQHRRSRLSYLPALDGIQAVAIRAFRRRGRWPPLRHPAGTAGVRSTSDRARAATWRLAARTRLRLDEGERAVPAVALSMRAVARDVLVVVSKREEEVEERGPFRRQSAIPSVAATCSAYES